MHITKGQSPTNTNILETRKHPVGERFHSRQSQQNLNRCRQPQISRAFHCTRTSGSASSHQLPPPQSTIDGAYARCIQAAQANTVCSCDVGFIRDCDLDYDQAHAACRLVRHRARPDSESDAGQRRLREGQDLFNFRNGPPSTLPQHHCCAQLHNDSDSEGSSETDLDMPGLVDKVNKE
jgi:hypothetical protein